MENKLINNNEMKMKKIKWQKAAAQNSYQRVKQVYGVYSSTPAGKA